MRLAIRPSRGRRSCRSAQLEAAVLLYTYSWMWRDPDIFHLDVSAGHFLPRLSVLKQRNLLIISILGLGLWGVRCLWGALGVPGTYTYNFPCKLRPGCIFSSKKLTTFFWSSPLKDGLLLLHEPLPPPNLPRPAQKLLKIVSYSAWGALGVLRVHLQIFPINYA